MNSYYITKMLRILIFYIVIQTAAGGLTKKQRFNKILSNIHDLFRERSFDRTIGHSTKQVEAEDDYSDLNSVDENNKEENDKKQLEAILADVTNSLDKIKSELLKFSEDGIIAYDGPIEKPENRHKREIANETLANVTMTLLKKNVTEYNVTVTEKAVPLAVAVTEKPVTVVTVKNETVAPKAVLRENDETESNLSGRRMVPDFVTTTSRVKDKLLSYLEDTFNEVERKIKPLTNIKIALSNDDHYRIGYIIATIDTLEVNLKKLRNDMNLHQHNWDDEKILDLFDRIKATNAVTSTLIESLKKYLPKH